MKREVLKLERDIDEDYSFNTDSYSHGTFDPHAVAVLYDDRWLIVHEHNGSSAEDEMYGKDIMVELYDIQNVIKDDAICVIYWYHSFETDSIGLGKPDEKKFDYWWNVNPIPHYVWIELMARLVGEIKLEA